VERVFIFSLFYLFGHYGAIQAVDLHSPLLLAILIVALAMVPLGNLFPEKIRSCRNALLRRQLATSIWCFRAGAEDKMEANIVKSSALVVNQLAKLYDPATAEIMSDKTSAFRRCTPMAGRSTACCARFGAGANEADYSVREGEIVAGPRRLELREGHLHNEQLLEAVQRRCNFEDGDVRIIVLEGQPIHTQRQCTASSTLRRV